eukprot:3145282-Rhodomonas_salina.1
MPSQTSPGRSEREGEGWIDPSTPAHERCMWKGRRGRRMEAGKKGKAEEGAEGSGRDGRGQGG